jgi:hypothetical protein
MNAQQIAASTIKDICRNGSRRPADVAASYGEDVRKMIAAGFDADIIKLYAQIAFSLAAIELVGEEARR